MTDIEGKELVVTHPCPRCYGVDKLACPRCGGYGRVANRTRAEQVEQFLRAEEADAVLGLLSPPGHEFDLPRVGPNTMAAARAASVAIRKRQAEIERYYDGLHLAAKPKLNLTPVVD